MRYGLAKLRAKRLVLKLPNTQMYRLSPQGARICVLFLKRSHRVYTPLVAADLLPVAHDAVPTENRRSPLDQLVQDWGQALTVCAHVGERYAAVDRALDLLLDHLGFSRAA